MNVTIQLYGIRKELIDLPMVELSVPQDATLRTALLMLAKQFGDRVLNRLFSADGKRLSDMICLSVNDSVVSDSALDCRLSSLGKGSTEIGLAVVFSIAGG